MKQYNYKIVFNSGQVTELLKCDKPLELTDAKWYKINYLDKDKSITINIANVNTIEEWITEE